MTMSLREQVTAAMPVYRRPFACRVSAWEMAAKSEHVDTYTILLEKEWRQIEYYIPPLALVQDSKPALSTLDAVQNRLSLYGSQGPWYKTQPSTPAA